MIYMLCDTDTRAIKIAVCERTDRVQVYQERGYRVVTRAEYIEAWHWRDYLTLTGQIAYLRLRGRKPAWDKSNRVGA